jgi:hypothetical protein
MIYFVAAHDLLRFLTFASLLRIDPIMRIFRKKPKVAPATAVPDPLDPPLDRLLGDADAHRFGRELAKGRWLEYHDFLVALPDARHRDFYLLHLIPEGGPRPWMDEWAAARPESTLPLVFRGRGKALWAWEARGNGRGKTVKKDSWPVFYRRLVDADRDFAQAAAADESDPLPHEYSIWVATGLSLGQVEVQRRYAEVERRERLDSAAGIAMIQATARKWGGSHDGMFKFAHSVSAQAPDGHSAHKLVALAHIERWLDLPKEQQPAYFHAEAVRAEIRAAADRSVRSPLYTGGRLDPVDRNPFAMCFYLMRDYEAQLEQMRLIGPHITAAPWQYLGKAGRAFERARQNAQEATGGAAG